VTTNERPLVGIIMGSKSDLGTLRDAATIVAEFEVPCESRVVSASSQSSEWKGSVGAAVFFDRTETT